MGVEEGMAVGLMLMEGEVVGETLGLRVGASEGDIVGMGVVGDVSTMSVILRVGGGDVGLFVG